MFVTPSPGQKIAFPLNAGDVKDGRGEMVVEGVVRSGPFQAFSGNAFCKSGQICLENVTLHCRVKDIDIAPYQWPGYFTEWTVSLPSGQFQSSSGDYFDDVEEAKRASWQKLEDCRVNKIKPRVGIL